LGEYYLNREQAEIARWNSLARFYAANSTAGDIAESARWNGLAHFYRTGELSGGRAESAETARLNALAFYLFARGGANQAYADRLTGLAKFYGSGK
jgi:hypothetical protein